MKIGILTFSSAVNFGALLQAYALQQALKKLGFDALHIYTGKPYMSSRIKYKIKHKLERKKNNSYQNFLINKLEFYPETINENNAVKLNKVFDAFISGSDQIWNVTNGVNPLWFQMFVRTTKKKISYAASVGIEKIPESYQEELGKALDSFDAISVRERYSVHELKKYTDKNIQSNIDPVFLLSANEWDSILSDQIENCRYIFVYGTQMSDELKTVAYRLKKKTGFKIVSVFPMRGAKIIGRKTGPLEFVNYVKYAEYVVTSSFHCTAFAIIYHKRIIECLHSLTGARAKNILEIFDQTDSIYTGSDFCYDKEWDYSNTDDIIQIKASEAKEYLISSLTMKKQEWKTENSQLDRRLKHMGFVLNGDVIGKPQFYCTGCNMCSEICPTSAITMEMNGSGFYYPQIDLDKCIHCNLCHTKCPAVFEAYKNKNNCIEIYAVRSKSKEILNGSSSGGAFIHLSNYILQKNGVIYGCQFDSNNHAICGRAETQKERNAFRGSKYVQSFMGKSYSLIEYDLTHGRYVLFSGTPCQVNAVKTYLIIKHVDTSLLFTIDLVCHGCPSPFIWQEHLNILNKKYQSTIKEISFRCKDGKGTTQALNIQYRNGKNYFARAGHDLYYNLFLKNYILRESCYSCRFTSLYREGDITLADFGRSNLVKPEFNADHMGVSQVHINSEKGKGWFNNILNDIEYFQIKLEDAMQPNLQSPTKKPVGYDEFQKTCSMEGYEKAAWRVLPFKEKIQIILQRMNLNEFFYKIRHQ